jgi:uncharacterized phage protein gp47/JayE
MPWTTPTLRNVREMVRGEITATLAGASFVGNSVLRVLADAQAALAHLVLRYLDWLSRQFLPDTAEAEWLDRHGDIWLVNADGSVGRKVATLAHGSVTMTGTVGIVVPAATQLTSGAVSYETVADITIAANAPTPADILALNPGTVGNLDAGTALGFVVGISGVDGTATVVELTGGSDQETDAELRTRVLKRIQQPPMGGAAYDYEAWALAVPGVTRAWCTSEMGIGTVTVRFMMDDLRADNGGFPLQEDIDAVSAYIDTKRPVSVKDCFVLSPIPYPIDFNIVNLMPDTEAVRGAIEASIEAMLFYYATPGQTIFAAWKYSAVMGASGVSSFDMSNTADDVMPSVGHMAVLGDIYYSTGAVAAAAIPQLAYG